MSGDRIDALVLGATGPIGAAVGRLSASTGMAFRLSGPRGADAVDVRNPSSVEHALVESRPRVIVDLSNPFARGEGVDAALAALNQLVNAATRHGVEKIVFASSAAVYGDGGSRMFAEDDDLRGSSPYAQWKIGGERALAAAHESTGLAFAALRIFNVFGPGCDGSLANRLINGSVPALAMTDAFVRDYVHVDDVADAIHRAVRSEISALIANVSTGVAIDNLQLAEAVPSTAYVASHPIVSYSVGDPVRARADLGWVAKRSVIQFLHDVAAGFG